MKKQKNAPNPRTQDSEPGSPKEPIDGHDSDHQIEEDGEEPYAGRQISRAERLRQMREAQKLLREQRKNKVKTLEKENARLQQELRNYATLVDVNCGYIDKLQIYPQTIFFPPQLVENPHIEVYAKFNIMSLFSQVPPDLLHKLYVSPTDNLVYLTYFKVLKYIKQCRTLGDAGESRLAYTIFRHAPDVGTKMDFTEHLEIFVRSTRVAPMWLDTHGKLPGTFMPVLGVVEFLLKYADILYINMKVLSSFMASMTFATYWGPAICVSDLSKCITVASDPTFDPSSVAAVLEKQVDSFVAASQKALFSR